MRIRVVTPADVPFLERMMLFAGFSPGRPLPSNARSMPHVRRFIEGWGGGGDVGVIAIDEQERALGAAWARTLDEPLVIDSAGAAVAEIAALSRLMPVAWERAPRCCAPLSEPPPPRGIGSCRSGSRVAIRRLGSMSAPATRSSATTSMA